jgi:dephospho-CoA kinase
LDELRSILRAHRKRYPLLEPVDLAKLIYQNEFGNGHFIQDEAASLARLKQEVSQLRSSGSQLFEPIGNGLDRLHLGALGDTLPLETVHRFFVVTAAVPRGSVRGFEQKLEVLRELCPDDSLDSFLAGYQQAGYPPISHSTRYKEEYAPSYRVVRSDFALYYPIFKAVEELLRQTERITVAIDGPSGSGKSSLGQRLHDVYGCPVIAMDHFFLRPEQRTEKRLEAPGGNIDHERFQAEVLEKLRGGRPFSYRVYDCQRDELTRTHTISPHQLTVVEGCYSHHPAFVGDHDLRVFLKVSPNLQRSRLLQRNGPAMLKRFLQEWIPLEERYFAAFGIPGHSQIVLDTGANGWDGPKGVS